MKKLLVALSLFVSAIASAEQMGEEFVKTKNRSALQTQIAGGDGSTLVNVQGRDTALGPYGGLEILPALIDSTGHLDLLHLDGTGALKVAGSFTGSSASVGVVGAASPTSADQIGWQDGSGNLQAVSAANPLPVSGTISATNPSVGTNTAAIPGSSTLVGAKDGSGNLSPLDKTGNGLKVDGSAVTQPVSGTVAVSNFPASQAVTGTFWQATQPVSGSVSVSNFPASQAVTGTFWQSTQPVSIASTVNTSDSHTAAATPLSCRLSDGAAFYAGPTTSQLPTALDGSGFLKTHEQGTAAISAASLPLPSGAATSARQPALGTAGSASADVITVQGIASMTALKTDGSGVTQPVSGTVSVSNFPATQTVSGTVTANAGSGTFNISAIPTGTNTIGSIKVTDGTNTASVTASNAVKVDGSAVTQPVSVADNRLTGTISAASSFGSIGGNSWNSTSCAANACVTATVNGNADANVYITGQWSGTVYIDGSPDGTNWTDMVAANMGVLVAPTFHSGLAGAGVGSTQTAVYKMNVSGFQQVRVRAATGTTFGAANITVQWNITPASGSVVSLDRALPTGSNTIGAVTQSGTWNVNSSQAGTWNMNALQSGTWTVQPGNTANTVAWKVDNSAVTQPISASSLPLPSGAATSAKQPALGTAGTPSLDVLTVQGATSMTPLKVDGSASTQPVSGTVTANVGTTNGLALDATLTGRTAKTQITDGTRDGTVKAASTLAASTDTALVITPRDATPDTRVTGTISAASSFGAISANSWSSTACAANACVTANTSGNGSSSVFITGQWSGTVYVEATPDGTNWAPMIVQNMGTVAGSPTFHTGLAGAGVASIQTAMYRTDAAGFQSVRLRAGTGTTFGAANISVTWNLTNVAIPLSTISNALPAGTSAIGGVTQSGTWTVQPGNTANSTAWKVDGSGVTQPISGSVNQGVQGSASSPWFMAITDSATSTKATVTGSNALKVDGSAVTQPVSGTVAATESGTWTVQPGNTANTTPWLVKTNDGTNSITVKAASTAAVAGDTSEVVAISPNSNTVQNIEQSSTAVSYASSSATVSTPTATGSNTSLTYLWHPSTSAKRVEIDHIGVVCSSGAATTGGFLLLSLVRITAENATPGGVTATTANPKMDNADANSTVTIRWGATGIPTRATNAAVNQLLPNNAWSGNEVIMWSTTKTGKPLVARASVAEGWEVYVSTSTTMSTAATCEVNFYWTES